MAGQKTISSTYTPPGIDVYILPSTAETGTPYPWTTVNSAIDGNVLSFATASPVPAVPSHTWTSYLTATYNRPMLSDKCRYIASFETTGWAIEISIYYEGAYHVICYEVLVRYAWRVIDYYCGGKLINSLRVRYYNTTDGNLVHRELAEIQANKI